MTPQVNPPMTAEDLRKQFEKEKGHPAFWGYGHGLTFAYTEYVEHLESRLLSQRDEIIEE